MTSSLSHKLTYWDGPGRAEVTRILLHAAGIPFEDHRIQYVEWLTLKPTTPLGFIPILEIDHKTPPFCQSMALARYAAKQAGMYPSDPLEALVVDEALDCVAELTANAPQAPDPEEKKKKRHEYQATTMTQYSLFLESRIHQYGTGSSFVRSGTCMADLVLMTLVKSVTSCDWDHIDPNFFDQFPGIIATYKAASDHPKVKAYYESVKK